MRPPNNAGNQSTNQEDESRIRRMLRERGCPEHVVQGGSAGLIAGWRRFVKEVEQGYRMGLDEYRNDLDVRELIGVAGLGDLVGEDDRHFREALTATDRKVWESDDPDAFWVRGYPRNAAGDLLADLRSEGLA